MRLGAAIILMLALTASASASGVATVFSLGGGTCRDWITSDNNQEYQVWMLGYISGEAASGLYSRNVLAGTSPTTSLMWLHKYCQEHMQESLGSAGKALIRELTSHPQKSN